MANPTQNSKLPIFDKKGVLQLEKILSKKDAYLEAYKPESSYLYCAITALHKFETIYSQYKFEKNHGKIFAAYKSRMFNVGDGTFKMEAHSKDDRTFTIFLLTLKSLELSISEYINSKINGASIQVAMSRLVQQTYSLGMLRGSEYVNDDLKSKLFKIERFDRRKVARDDYIRTLINENPGKKYLALYELSDKNIIGGIKSETFENLCSKLK